MAGLLGRFLSLFVGAAPDKVESADAHQKLSEPWQDRVRRLQLPEDERQPVHSLAQSKSAHSLVDDAAIIRERVLHSGLTQGREQDIAFYVRAHKAGQLVGDHVRKFGTHLSKVQKQELGISYRGILAAEFLETLSDAGLADPVHAAWVIGGTVNRATSNAANLAKLAEEDLYAHFLASNMAAGPCPRAASMDGKRYRPQAAQVPPFADCPHPDQCACMYRGALSEHGEF